MTRQFQERSSDDVDVEARLRDDLQMRPSPPFAPNLQSVKRRGLRRRRRARILPVAVAVAVVGVGVTAVATDLLPGSQRQGAVSVVAAGDSQARTDANRDTPAWCQGGTITYDSDGTGYASPELALQYLMDVAAAQDENLKSQPASAEVDDALAKNSAILVALTAVKLEAGSLGLGRAPQDGPVVARDPSGEVIAQAQLEEVQPGQWVVKTLRFAAPTVPECNR